MLVDLFDLIPKHASSFTTFSDEKSLSFDDTEYAERNNFDSWSDDANANLLYKAQVETHVARSSSLKLRCNDVATQNR